MRILSFCRSYGLFVLISITLILIAFKDLPGTFFQQDELWGFGLFNLREGIGGPGYVIKDMVLAPGNVHYNPLTVLGFYLQYKLFHLNFSSYAFFSLFTHTFNVFLVYIFVNKILKNKYLSFLTAMLFAVNSTSHQAVTWVASSLNTQGSNLFSLLFYILFLDYLENKIKNKKILILSIFFLAVSLLFKENVAPFLLAPLLYLFYSPDKNILSLKKTFKPFILFMTVYLPFRLFMYFSIPITAGSLGQKELIQTGIPEYLFRILILPFRIIAQSLLHAKYLLGISQKMLQLGYPQLGFPDGLVNPLLRETLSYDIVSLFIAIAIVIGVFFSYELFKKQNKYFSKGIIIFLLITILSDIAIVLIPGKFGYASLISSRYLYPGSFGGAGLLVLILFAFISWVFKNKSKIFLTGPVFLIILFNILIIRSDISGLKEVSDARKYILTDIASTYPRFPKKVIIYIQSDKSYYGMPDKEKNLPVQIGFGWIVLVWYQKNENFPSCLYNADLFLDLRSQGYKECDGRGFGYFRDYDKLLTTIKTYKTSINNIIAYSWEGKNEAFKDISKEIHEKIKKDINKNEITK